ncbi:hypothetical protein MXD62_16775 [Frankia sp. Mgl5]|uniref:hypothetical protein n=1 Tax=Frankia sp. Mgl5 TaxID=2933793 RepID=UPI00200EAAB9|nr:hypothetical protein [Frankia sp. Mgl5]MCK9928811.1 hypothetical protein [Frankia sp. Mgl5]
MSDSSITAKDAGGATITIDTQNVGGSGQHQQAVVIGDGVNVGRVVGIDSAGAASVRPRAASTATLVNVSASLSSVTIRAANSARLGLIVVNDSTADLYLTFDGTTASTSNYSIKLPPGATYEMTIVVTTLITGVWSAASGTARVTELT